MNEKLDYLLASFDFHLDRGKEPREAWGLAVEDYAFVYGPNADPDRLPVSLAAEVALKYMRKDKMLKNQKGEYRCPDCGWECVVVLVAAEKPLDDVECADCGKRAYLVTQESSQ